MNRTISEIDMSVDDSLIISNGVTNVLNEDFDQQGEQCQLNTTIDQFKPTQSIEQNEQIKQIETNDSKDNVIVVNEETSNQQVIEEKENDQPNDNLKTVQVKQDSASTLNIQQIIDQINQNEQIKSEQKVDCGEQIIPTSQSKVQKKHLNESLKSVEMNADESLRSNDNPSISIKVDMSVDDSLVLNDIRNIFETSTNSTSEFIITKPLKKIETPKRPVSKDNEMDMSCTEDDDVLNLKSIKVVNNPIDCLDNSPFVKTLPPPKPVFKLSRKRLNCETDSPDKKTPLSSNLYRDRFNRNSLNSTSKKWRSATYNPMTSSPIKMHLGSPLKQLDCNLMNNNVFNRVQPTSMSNLNMMIQKSDQTPNLMGDYSNEYALPLVSCARHKDLKTINGQTLINLMDGKYNGSISCFTIVDARYPYEFDGGHIDGAKNIYLREDINKYFFGTEKPTLITEKNLINNTIEKNIKQSSSYSMQRDQLTNLKNFETVTKVNINSKRLSAIEEGENDENSCKSEISKSNITIESDPKIEKLKRHAIIFHCEFSSERGPAMCRHLRKIDRELNENRYPNLYYPEIYLLGGGYKLFFEKYRNHCYPQSYLPMNSQNHKEDLLKFRKKSKTWSCQEQQKFKSLYSF